MSRSPAFIAVDWGSSNFRASLISARGEVLDQRLSDQGAFQISNHEETLAAMCGDWCTAYGPVPIRMGGSIGSRNGWCDTGYLPCPISLDDLKPAFVRVENHLGWDIAILPGVSETSGVAECDVMRGEEIQIFGALQTLNIETGWFCLPGTHSKWCRVEKGQITSIRSYLSGEMYALLLSGGSLSPLIEGTEFDEQAFLQGLHAIKRQSNLLSFLFRARAGVLLDQFSGDRLASFLSGALIAYEVGHATTSLSKGGEVAIIAGPALETHYQLALQELGQPHRVVGGEEAFLAGMKLLVG